MARVTRGGSSPYLGRAIRLYCERNDLKPLLSAPPYYRFVNKDGEEHQVIASELLALAKVKVKPAKKEAADGTR